MPDGPSRSGRSHRYQIDRVAMCHAALAAGIRPTGRSIALAAGISAQTLNALWTNSEREPSLKVMTAIVNVLGGELTDYLILVEPESDTGTPAAPGE